MAKRTFTDPAGDVVLRFATDVKNLSRVGELTDEIVSMAQSGEWRRYRTALGVDEWGECEFDFFLIACGLAWDDVSRVLAWSGKGAELAPLMDPSANKTRRRSLDEAATAWHAPGPETLVERAQRLGWTKQDSTTLRVPPLSHRARVRHSKGTTLEQQAQQSRQAGIPARRRRELDALARQVAKQTADETEYRYVLDRLRTRTTPGRPRKTEAELEQWRRAAERLDWDSARLAEHWGIARGTAQNRLAQLRRS